MSKGNEIARTVTLAAGMFFFGALSGVMLTDSSGEKATTDSELEAAVNKGGVTLLGDEDCPDGGAIWDKPMVVQDYSEPGESDSDLYAVNPQRVYVKLGKTAFCGPDFGQNGERFDGNAVIVVGPSTITSTNVQ